MSIPSRRLATLTGALVLAVAALTACSSSPSPAPASGSSGAGTPGALSQMTPLRVATNNAAGALPILAGVQEGIFEKYNLDVTQETIPDITLIPAGLGQQWDFGYSVGPITINAANSGLPIAAAVGNEYEDGDGTPGSEIIAAPGITKPSDLVGKTIGAPTLTGNINLATKAWLRANGVDPSSVNFVAVPTPNMLDQLKGGLVQAVELQVPFLAAAEADGFTNLGSPIPDAVGVPIAMTWWATNRDWAAQHPDVVAAYRAALGEVVSWIKANPEQAQKIVADFTGMDPSLVATIDLPGLFDTAVSADDIERWGKLMETEGGFVPNVDYANLVVQ